MVSPDDQLKQQAGKVDKSQQECEDAYCSRVNETAAPSISTLGNPEKMKDLTVANASTVDELRDNKEQQQSRTIYGSNTQNYRNKIGYHIATAEKSVDDLINQKRIISPDYNHLPPGTDIGKNMTIDFSSSPSETVLTDVQSFFSKSGITVPPTFGRLLGCDSRMALTKRSLKNSNASFVDYTSIDAALSSSATNGSTLKSPTFSMSDIAVVVPSHVVLSDSNSEEAATDDEIPLETDRSSSKANNNNNSTPSDCSYEDDNQMVDNPEQTNQSDSFDEENFKPELEPKSGLGDACASISDGDGSFSTSAQGSSCIAIASKKNDNKVTNASMNSVCQGDYDLQITCEDRSVSDRSSSPSRISVEMGTDGLLNCSTTEVKSNISEAATDSTNNAPESCSSFDLAEELIDPFDNCFNFLLDDTSEWQKVSGARNKQKRKQNRSLSSTKKTERQQHPRYNTVRTTASFTKEPEKVIYCRTSQQQHTTPRNIPNRILRARAKQHQQQQINPMLKSHTANSQDKVSLPLSSVVRVSDPTCTACTQGKVSAPMSSVRRISDTTEVIWSKPVAQSRTTVKVSMSNK